MARGKYQEWLDPDGLLKLEAWARDGLTDEDISKKMGIVPSTLYEWRRKYSEISESLKRGKEVVDIQVENALLKRALGYSYNEDKYMCVEMDQNEYYINREAFMNEYKYNHPEASQEELNRVKAEFPKTKMVLTERKTKEIVPDTTAQIFWLKNRKSTNWGDRNTDLDKKEQEARIKMFEAQINKMTGDNAETEDMSEVEADVYGSD